LYSLPAASNRPVISARCAAVTYSEKDATKVEASFGRFRARLTALLRNRRTHDG
jgi:hypothetical protein